MSSLLFSTYCLETGSLKEPKLRFQLEEQLVNSGDMPVFALQYWAYSDMQPCPCFYVDAEIQTQIFMLPEQAHLLTGYPPSPSLLLMLFPLPACMQAFTFDLLRIHPVSFFL